MKPILFNTEMVRAILDGRKTVTRRVIKPQTVTSNTPDGQVVRSLDDFIASNAKDAELPCVACSPYQVGDVLYVRETFVKADDGYHYRADATSDSEQLRKDYGYKYRPSIHMPKEAARIFLRVTGVRVERLQEIDKHWDSYDKEGVRNPEFENISIAMQEKFISIWNSTIKPADHEQYSWEANPWVWVIEFERIEKP